VAVNDDILLTILSTYFIKDVGEDDGTDDG
jgi:hypothetical protein